MGVMVDLKHRGVRDVFFVVCDGERGLPGAVEAVRPEAIVRNCFVHLIRHTFWLISRAGGDAIERDVKPVHTVVKADSAWAAPAHPEEKWGSEYRAVIRSRRSARNKFIAFLDDDVDIRKVVCSTNAIESSNARRRRSVRIRVHFPSERAALNCRFLVTRGPDSTGAGRARWAMCREQVLNAFAITFGDCRPVAESNRLRTSNNRSRYGTDRRRVNI
jgi:putative transposase